MRFAPQDVAFVADPYPVYEELRTSAPVIYDAATDHWLVTRHRDVDMSSTSAWARRSVVSSSRHRSGRSSNASRGWSRWRSRDGSRATSSAVSPACASGSAKVRAMDEDRHDETYRRGRERFLEIHDEKALRTVEGLGDLGRHIIEFVYGEMYTKPALTDRDRELGAVVALTALGRSSQLPQHLRASLKAGLTPDQLREAIMLTATIAGFPPAMNAMATLKSVLADRDRPPARADPPEDRA
jgi:4-carboxymuconolactone decarboxylase